MRGRYKPKAHSAIEFELDLAPLLAVMVKLVPVLLVSSAFIQVMNIETELPQVVKEAIANQENQKKKVSIQLEASRSEIKILIDDNGKLSTEVVPNNKDGSFDFTNLNTKLQSVKLSYPEVFKIELSPNGDISYKEIVKIMDEARKSRDRKIRFPVFDSKQNKMVDTDYMFPDVVFANMMEG